MHDCGNECCMLNDIRGLIGSLLTTGRRGNQSAQKLGSRDKRGAHSWCPENGPIEIPLIMCPLDCCKGLDTGCNISTSVQHLSTLSKPSLAISPIRRGLGCCCSLIMETCLA